MSILNKQRIEKIEKLTWSMAKAKGIPIDDIYDLTQDILLDVHERDTQGKLPADGVDAYITVMIKSTIVDWLRVNKSTVSLDEIDIADEHNSIDDMEVKVTLDQLRKNLTPWECKIYDRIRQGLSNAEIAEELNTTKATIETASSNIIKKLKNCI
jgi:RNA polymerase sigma factor (sigma-70 family)